MENKNKLDINETATVENDSADTINDNGSEQITFEDVIRELEENTKDENLDAESVTVENLNVDKKECNCESKKVESNTKKIFSFDNVSKIIIIILLGILTYNSFKIVENTSCNNNLSYTIKTHSFNRDNSNYKYKVLPYIDEIGDYSNPFLIG